MQPTCALGATGLRYPHASHGSLGFCCCKTWGAEGFYPMFTSLYYLSLKNLQWFLMKIHLYALWISKMFCLIGFMLFYVNFIWFLLNWTVKDRVLFCSDFFLLIYAAPWTPCSSWVRSFLQMSLNPHSSDGSSERYQGMKSHSCVHCHCMSWQFTVGHHLVTFGPYNKKIKKTVCTWRHHYLWSDL